MSDVASNVLAYEMPLWGEGKVVAGLDEAGRGAWAGPVVAASVILPPESERVLDVLAGVDDSKRLSPAAREGLYDRIREVAASAVGVIPPDVIDAIGILNATYRAMHAALAALPQPPDALLIDYIPHALGDWPQQRLVRGERASLSIAAASIIAKVHRDRLMVELDARYPGYGFARHKGYGTRAHRRALDALGPCPIHRHSWAPIRQLRLPLDG
ncbi:MAG TPA: ribonuclease HII [Anaerolineae bacterium]|nr:ribonuclease HII [Anaerolineae bacterium]HIQ12283.1 ribonuclease HII [Caldilineales bacterium]